ncbi:protein pufQ [Sulfitobacter sp. JBTF-M27]|uniref:Protein pufQ n=1 Tax=Sulfitobacter sediminilitoris TaxID=2698830 RepID=A0A6P0CD14_9RHOB|nr:cytochrome PufQ [Sulfitobacter sediminilitoris]NEK24131.1 protein pufQ [Sulfitobacter sediminilitoris]
MTDMTTETIHVEPHRAKSGPPMREYYVYFAIIFAATLPLTILTWVLSTARRMELPERGPIKAAWSQANIITPRIFSA